jgi:hypothetical protein
MFRLMSKVVHEAGILSAGLVLQGHVYAADDAAAEERHIRLLDVVQWIEVARRVLFVVPFKLQIVAVLLAYRSLLLFLGFGTLSEVLCLE